MSMNYLRLTQPWNAGTKKQALSKGETIITPPGNRPSRSKKKSSLSTRRVQISVSKAPSVQLTQCAYIRMGK